MCVLFLESRLPEIPLSCNLCSSISAQGLPGTEVSGVLGKYQKQLSGGGLSITDLVAAGTSLSNTRHCDSDDDYD